MATTEENLKAFLLASSSIAAIVGPRVSYNHIPQTVKPSYIFFQQSGSPDDPALDDSPGVSTRAQYAIECYSTSPSVAITLKNLVHARLNKYRGAFGDTTAKGIFAADVDDSYTPQGAGSDAGIHCATLTAEVVL